jgi:hypothetical protein
MREKIQQIIDEAAEGGINLHSEVARAMLVEKLMIAFGYYILENKLFEEDMING